MAATKEEARKVVSLLPDNERRNFVTKFKQLDSDEKRQIAIDRLVEQAQPEQVIPEEKPRIAVESFGDVPGAIAENLQLGLSNLPTKISQAAQAAPAVGQFTGGILAGTLAGGGLSRTSNLARFLPKIARPVTAAGDVAGAVGGILGRTAGLQFREQAEDAPLRTTAREILTPIASAQGLPVSPLASAIPPVEIEPERKIEMLQDVGVTTAIELGTLAGIRGLGRMARSAFTTALTSKVKDLTRALGGVFRQTVKEAKRVGAPRIKRVAERVFQKGAGFFTDELVPRVQQGVNQIINNFSDNTSNFLKSSGVSQGSINRLKTVGINTLRNVKNKFSGGFDELAEAANTGLSENLKKAGKVFDIVFNKSKEKIINGKNTFFKLQNQLQEIGAIDANGARTQQEFGSAVIDKLIDIYDDMRRFFISEGRTETGRILPKLEFTKAQYNRFLLRLESAISGNNKVDRFLYNTLKNLRQDATNSIPGLTNAMKIYSVAKQNFDDGIDKVGKILKKRKISLTERKLLQKLDDALPNNRKFLKDFDNFKAADEIIKVVDDNLDPLQIEKNLSAFAGFKKPGLSKMNQTKQLLSFLPDKEISDDALAFFLVDDLFQETLPAGFGGAAGISRSVFEAITRKGIEFGTPSAKRRITKSVLGRTLPTAITEAQQQ